MLNSSLRYMGISGAYQEMNGALRTLIQTQRDLGISGVLQKVHRHVGISGAYQEMNGALRTLIQTQRDLGISGVLQKVHRHVGISGAYQGMNGTLGALIQPRKSLGEAGAFGQIQRHMGISGAYQGVNSALGALIQPRKSLEVIGALQKIQRHMGISGAYQGVNSALGALIQSRKSLEAFGTLQHVHSHISFLQEMSARLFGGRVSKALQRIKNFEFLRQIERVLTGETDFILFLTELGFRPGHSPVSLGMFWEACCLVYTRIMSRLDRDLPQRMREYFCGAVRKEAKRLEDREKWKVSRQCNAEQEFVQLSPFLYEMGWYRFGGTPEEEAIRKEDVYSMLLALNDLSDEKYRDFLEKYFSDERSLSKIIEEDYDGSWTVWQCLQRMAKRRIN